MTPEQKIAQHVQDPVWFTREVLGDNPWEHQALILRSLRKYREVNVKSCHSAGKSWLASRAVLWFLYAHPECMVITTAPTHRQVRAILWKEIRAAHKAAAIPLGGRLMTTQLELSPSWFAWGFTAPEHDPTRWQGYHADNILVVVDEACGIKAPVDAAIDSILSGQGGRLLRIGNPTNEATPFGDAFKAPGNRYNHTISAFDTPNFTHFGITRGDIIDGSWQHKIDGRPLPRPHLIAPEWVADKAQGWGINSPMFQSRIDANFPDADDNVVVPFSLAQRGQELETEDPFGPPILGVDIAHMGTDETVVVLRKGRFARVVDSWVKASTMETVGRIITCINKYQPVGVYIDGIGIGAGVVDRLVEQGIEVNSVNVGKSAWDSDRFANLRAELFWKIRERLEADELDLDPLDDVLVSQLTKIRYTVNSAGKVILEAKAKMGKSPDRADALSLTFAHTSSSSDINISDAGLRTSPWLMT